MASVRKREWIAPTGEKKQAWVVDYVDGEGKRRLKTCRSKKAADAVRLKVETELDAGTHTAAKASATVEHVCDLFMKEAELRLAREEIGKYRLKNYQVAVDTHVIPNMGKIIFSKLQATDIERWSNGLIKKGLQPRTIRGYLKILRLVELFAIKRRFTRVSVVPEVQRDYQSVSIARVRVPSQDDVRAIFVALDGPPPWKHQRRRWLLMRCFVLLEAVCGLRFGEVVALKLGDLDFDRRTIHVRNSLTYWDDLKGPKTANGIRDVPMPEALIGPLKEWLGSCYVPNDRQLVFRAATGGPVAHCSVWATWQKLLEHAGVERCRPHALRHFAASMMGDRGLPPADIAKLLGHASFDITLRVYTHAMGSADRNRIAIDGLAMELAGPTGQQGMQQVSNIADRPLI